MKTLTLEIGTCLECPHYRANLFAFVSGCTKFKIQFSKENANHIELSDGLFASCPLPTRKEGTNDTGRVRRNEKESTEP